MKNRLNYFLEVEDEEIDDYQPERNLLAALLDRAIMDSWEEHDQALKRDIRSWLNRKTTKYAQPFSFQWVCEYLDFDPDIMRMIIKNLDRDLYRKHR